MTHHFLEQLDHILLFSSIIIAIFCLAFGLDDLFVDLVALFYKQKPKALSETDITAMKMLPEKRLAIIVPAWQESGIIQRMLNGNRRRINYQNYTFFVGVYPNDPATISEVQQLAEADNQIVAVINDRPGPTSKGQILNHVVKTIAERGGFDAVVMHDAEDLVHPLGLKLMNAELANADFVQVPIFSLDREPFALVAGTYMDEFAEPHTKDLLVRGLLGAAIPSAGVGTAISWSAVKSLLSDGGVFREDTLTEDYDLGHRVKKFGYRSLFSCCWYKLGDTKEYIATREYFPKKFIRSIRQKTRWTIGIALQGWRNLGWEGSVADRYFLYRDRKGLVINLMSMVAYFASFYLAGKLIASNEDATFTKTMGIIGWIFVANGLLMLNRMYQRMHAVLRVYGPRSVYLMLVRWPLAITINALACLRAIKQDVFASTRKKPHAWVKTEHELPTNFGTTVALIFALAGGLLLASSKASAKCVQVYYDRMPKIEPRYYFGRQHTLMLQNLLGHFANIQQYIIPVEMYEKGQLGRCEANIYLGTHFENNLSKTFLEDVAATDRTFVWAGYKIWHMTPEQQAKLWGLKYKSLSTLDMNKRDPKGKPTFFRNYEYKGENFVKYAEWDRTDPKRFNAGFEIALFDLVDANENNVLVWARHNATNERTPYVVRKGMHWYIGESPFSFTTEEDRYLIIADLLFDILDEKPLHQGKRPAVLRFEDIHANVEPWQLYTMVDVTHKMNVPISMTVIPIFSDPLKSTSFDLESSFVPMTANPLFLEFVKYAKERNVRFIYHGVTHQLGHTKNPFTGMTGDDFEFWDRVNNKPIPGDSPLYVMHRLEVGQKILEASGIKVFAWLSPHYQASPLDYTVFGQLFSWNVGRMIYFPFETKQAKKIPDHLKMNRTSSAAVGLRDMYLKDLTVSYPPELMPTGQFFPYEIYGDVFGQRILPENIGNVQPYMNEQVYKTEKIEDMIRHIKLNRVIRDSWASFFIHPFSLEDTASEGLGLFPGDTSRVETIINEIRAAGFEFIDLETFAAKRSHIMRPKPIEHDVDAKGNVTVFVGGQRL